MALSELGQQFKRFARQKILDRVRTDGPQIDKDATYRAIRESFEGGADAPAELDTVREGDAAQWLTWTQEAVAELVQAGILAPAEGSGQLQATELGIDLSRLPAGFRDTQKTRELSAALRDVQPDVEFEKQARAKLDDFARRFPPDRLASMALNDYAMARNISQDDIRQIYAYARVYRTACAMLLYPATEGKAGKIADITVHDESKTRLAAWRIPLPEATSADGDGTLKALLADIHSPALV
jgi:hypothetical protein